ncbi:transglycosylase SLT domain-containing protein [Bradymonas sediminis]|nr:transglycosylase SLT domain-containing protein [Bradymonas sediminis]TDP73538.1 tetratricopeptide repeat protein [Bradymonas sediminis]
MRGGPRSCFIRIALSIIASGVFFVAPTVGGAADPGSAAESTSSDEAMNHPTQTQAALYREARALLDADPARAYQIAISLDADSDALRRVPERRLDLIAQAAERAGMVSEAVEALTALAGASKLPMDRLYAEVERGELLFLQGRLDACEDAIRVAGRAASKIDKDTAQSRYFIGRLWRLRHDRAQVLAGRAKDAAEANTHRSEARKAARVLLLDFPAEESARREGLSLSEDDLDDAELFTRARTLYAHWSYHESRRIFSDLLKNPAYEGRSKWYLGHLALNKLRDNPGRAEALFSDLAENGPYREESLYQVARAQMNQERYADALATLETYRERYPRGAHTESVYYYRGWLPYDHRENEAAVEGFRNYLARYGKRVGRASYVYGFLAWTYMRMGQWQNAVETYAEMKSFGNMLVWGKALYWQAYALHELQKDDDAIAVLETLRATYPVTYYGMLGEQLRARIVGEDERASKVWWPEDGAVVGAPKHAKTIADFELRGLSKTTAEAWSTVQDLVALDELSRARDVLSPIRDRLTRSVKPAERDAWTHALGKYIEDFHPMWVAATGGSIAANPRPPKPGTLRAEMAYPRAYESVVRDVSAEFDLPPELMWSIMRQESRYRPAQISYTDAVGALQMIPKTARKVARDLDITYNPRTFPKPSVGFRYSGYYLHKLLETFDGLIVPTAASYNSGPQIVAHWFRQNPDASFAWLIEEFAYNEGRNYARKVAEHMLRYLYLYESDPQRRGQILDQLFPTSRAIQLPDDVGY